jgi:type II secretory pathway pseudopilin PulG
MPALHRRHAAKRHAYTLIEMVVVTAIIMIMAGLILPNMVAVKASRELRSEQAALQRLPTEARNEAVKVKQIVDLRIEGDYIIMERTDPQTTSTTEVKRIPIGNQLSPQAAQLLTAGIVPSPNATSAGSSDVASWKWQAYADGTSDSGGLTFTVGGSQQQSLVIPADNQAHWIVGPLPQPTDQSWTAGDLEQRTSTTTSTGQAGGAARQ